MASVLVVEDQVETRRPMATLLKMQGYDVHTAADAYAAAAAIRNHSPDLVLLDVGIPPMDGLTLLMLLREEHHIQQLPPIVIVTGHDDPQTQSRAKALGVKAFLVKSRFSADDLLDAVRDNLRQPQPTADSGEPGSTP